MLGSMGAMAIPDPLFPLSAIPTQESGSSLVSSSLNRASCNVVKRFVCVAHLDTNAFSSLAHFPGKEIRSAK